MNEVKYQLQAIVRGQECPRYKFYNLSF